MKADNNAIAENYAAAKAGWCSLREASGLVEADNNPLPNMPQLAKVDKKENNRSGTLKCQKREAVADYPDYV